MQGVCMTSVIIDSACKDDERRAARRLLEGSIRSHPRGGRSRSAQRRLSVHGHDGEGLPAGQ